MSAPDTTAEGLLGLSIAKAREVFPGEVAAVKHRFRELASLWHPDHCSDPRAGDVLRKLLSLRDAAIRASEAGMDGACSLNERTFQSGDGRSFRHRYAVSHATDVGEVLIGDGTACYVFDESFADIADTEERSVRSLRYADAAMRAEMERFLPSLRKAVRSDGNGTVLAYEKRADEFLLADLVRAAGGRIDAVHVAWIVSGLENIACYLGWMGVAHGAIESLNVLVSPSRHAVRLVGGWGFATPLGSRPTALPGRTLDLHPGMLDHAAVAHSRLDLDLIRQVGRECLGDPSGGRLRREGTVPSAMAAWLALPPMDSAVSDYGSWRRAVEASFGKPRFVPWEMEAQAVYSAVA